MFKGLEKQTLPYYHKTAFYYKKYHDMSNFNQFKPRHSVYVELTLNYSLTVQFLENLIHKKVISFF